MKVEDVFFVYFEKFYYFVLDGCVEWVYVLLCEVLEVLGVIGIVCFVLYNKEYLVVLILVGLGLMLGILCWVDEICLFELLDLFKVGMVSFKLVELKMVC